MGMIHTYIDLADHLSDLVVDQAKWSQETFGFDQEIGPLGALKHLEKEAREASDAVGTTELPENLTDCFLLILDASRRAGITPFELVKLAQQKMKKNKARTCAKPVADEPVEQIESVIDWKLWVCDQVSGIHFLYRRGSEFEMRKALDQHHEVGRDVWLIDPDGKKHLPSQTTSKPVEESSTGKGE